MPTSVSLPALGESVTEGTVTRWLKQVGDSVAVDEPLLEVSTDKVDTEIPSPVAGTLLEISAQEDDVIAVGGQLGVIGSGAPASAPHRLPLRPPPRHPRPPLLLRLPSPHRSRLPPPRPTSPPPTAVRT